MSASASVNRDTQRRATVSLLIRSIGNLAIPISAAAARAVISGVAFRLNPLDPFGCLVDEAIRQAEVSRNSGKV
jgi:hypothetical protein